VVRRRISSGGLGGDARGLPSGRDTSVGKRRDESTRLPTNLLIGTSMAAIGLQVDFTLLRKHGPKLMLIAGSAWLLLFVAIFALCLIWK
jgi:hypothetical protein